MTDPRWILYPAFPMFLIAAFTLTRLAYLRFNAVAKGKMDPKFYRLYQQGEEPPEIRVFTRHFTNQFEMPVLFYAIILIAYVTGVVNLWTVGLAWAYVALRVVHSFIHLGRNAVLTRFRVYGASAVILLVLWTSVFAALVRGG